MTMSTNDGSKRKRSRWGNKNAPSPGNTSVSRSHVAISHKSGHASVSDDKAVEALLSSAQTNQEQKRPQQLPQLRLVPQVSQVPQQTTNRQKYGTTDNNISSSSLKSRNGGPHPVVKDNDGRSKRQRRQCERGREQNDDYEWGTTNTNSMDVEGRKSDDEEGGTNDGPKKAPQKPNFGLSGALAQDDGTGNVYNGVLLKFSEPPEARTPNTRWRLYVFKKKAVQHTESTSKEDADGDLLDVMHVSKQSAYLFGRDRKVADIPVDHPSLSKQHCVLQFRALPNDKDALRGQHQRHNLLCKPYMIDLESTNGTFVNGVKLEQARYYELRKGDVITLGFSSREYVLLTENTTSA